MKRGHAIILVIAIITVTATATAAQHDKRNVENFGVNDETHFQKRGRVIIYTSNRVKVVLKATWSRSV